MEDLQQLQQQLRQPIERMINSIAVALKLEVAVFDNEAHLVCCTPVYLKKKGRAVHAPSIQEVLHYGSIVVNTPGQMPSCIGCRFRDNCPSTMELLACINALLRRQGSQVDEMVYGNTSLDLSTGILVCGGQSVRLSAKEFDVMRLLLQAKGQNLSKEVILARVWGYDSNATENHVEVYVGFLRKKLRSIGSNLQIAAIRRLGYHLEVTEDA